MGNAGRGSGKIFLCPSTNYFDRIDLNTVLFASKCG